MITLAVALLLLIYNYNPFFVNICHGCVKYQLFQDNYGLDRIEVKDNGNGISLGNIPYAAKKHYTSKISSYADMNSLSTLGFRGEALGMLFITIVEVIV